MTIAYTDITAALNRAKERSGGYATDADNQLLTELLQLSSGIDKNDVVHYRPYLVAALFLEQCAQVQTLKEADNVVFTQLATMIAALKTLQLAIDNLYELVIPSGFLAITGGMKSPLPFLTTNYSIKAVI